MAIEWNEVRDTNLRALMDEMAADIEKRKKRGKKLRGQIYDDGMKKIAEGNRRRREEQCGAD